MRSTHIEGSFFQLFCLNPEEEWMFSDDSWKKSQGFKCAYQLSGQGSCNDTLVLKEIERITNQPSSVLQLFVSSSIQTYFVQQ